MARPTIEERGGTFVLTVPQFGSDRMVLPVPVEYDVTEQVVAVLRQYRPTRCRSGAGYVRRLTSRLR